MEDKFISAEAAHGFKYFYELTVGTIVAAFIAFQGWLTTKIIRHGEKLATLEAHHITRAEFQAWCEEQSLKLDELKSSATEAGNLSIAVVKESQARLELQLTRGLDRVESTQKELLLALARRGLQQDSR